jgi:hypothetical protein
VRIEGNGLEPEQLEAVLQATATPPRRPDRALP